MRMSPSRSNGAQQVAIITGAASGIGRATAERLQRLGMTLALADIAEEPLRAAAGELATRGTSVLSVVTDVTDLAACRRLMAAVHERFERIDVLVNSAGIVRPGIIDAVSDADVEQELRVNLFGVINTTRAVLPIMRQQQHGHIVNIASLAALTPLPGEAVYCASKYGVRGFSLSVALELRRTPLRVSLVHPDMVNTPMMAYEVTHGGAPLAFSGAILEPHAIADAVVQALQTGKREIAVPRSRGWLTTLGELVPALRDLLIDRLEQAGERKLARRRTAAR